MNLNEINNRGLECPRCAHPCWIIFIISCLIFDLGWDVWTDDLSSRAQNGVYVPLKGQRMLNAAKLLEIIRSSTKWNIIVLCCAFETYYSIVTCEMPVPPSCALLRRSHLCKINFVHIFRGVGEPLYVHVQSYYKFLPLPSPLWNGK